MPNIESVSNLKKCEAALELMAELSKAEKSAQEKGWIDIADVEKMLGISNGE